MAENYHFNKIDVGAIFRSVWGYNALPLWGLEKTETRRENSINGPAFYAVNNNGNEMFMPIWLIRADGTRLLLQNTVSNLSNQVTIVETPLVNRQGTVKEEISINDWVISVKGVIVSADGDYPDEQVAELNEIYTLREALGIENARTALVLDQDEKVVIKSLKFTEIKGVRSAQAFEMEMVSDLPFELYMED